MKRIFELFKVLVLCLLLIFVGHNLFQMYALLDVSGSTIFGSLDVKTNVALPDNKHGVTNVLYKNGNFILDSFVIENESAKILVKDNITVFDYDYSDTVVGNDNLQISITQNEDNGIYTDNNNYRVVKGIGNNQIAVISNSEEISKKVAENGYVVNEKKLEIFNHKISDDWAKGLEVRSDVIRLTKDNESIYIYYLSDEAVMYEDEYMLNTSAIISKTNETINGYNVYLMFDQTVLFEVLASSDKALEETFYVEVR